MHPVTLFPSLSSSLHTLTSLKHRGDVVTERDGFHALNKLFGMSSVRLKLCVRNMNKLLNVSLTFELETT